MIVDEIRRKLYELNDEAYREMQIRILPTLDPSSIIGVRTPELRRLAKELVRHPKIELFLADLPHRFFDENQLHAFIISLTKDFGTCLAQVQAFLPYVDNWATCDQLSPASFKRNPDDLLPPINDWVRSSAPYTQRFGIGMLMQHYLDDRFSPAYLNQVAGVQSDEYYVNMMIAWYFATALAKQYESTLPIIEQRKLQPWVHNKAIQKARESRRVPPEHKAYLQTLKVKAPKDS